MAKINDALYASFDDVSAPRITSDGYGNSFSYGQLYYPHDLFSDGGIDSSSYNNTFTAFFISFKQDPILSSKNNSSSVMSYNETMKSAKAKGSDSISSLQKSGASQGTIDGVINTLTSIGIGNGVAARIGKIVGPQLIGQAVAAGTGAIVGATTAGINDKKKFIDVKLDKQVQKTCICLPTPAFGTNYGLNWTEMDNKIVGGLLSSGANFINSLLGKDENGSNKDSKSLMDKVNASVNVMGNYLASSALDGDGTLSKTMQLLSRETANPRKEMMFNSVNMRTFNFEYVFAPQTREEARNVEKIIMQFKYHAHPSFHRTADEFDTPNTSNDNILNYPSEFNIVHYKDGKRNTHLPRMATCVLTDVGVDYSKGVESSFEDGMPSIIKLSLTFKEIAMLTKEDIANGY